MSETTATPEITPEGDPAGYDDASITAMLGEMRDDAPEPIADEAPEPEAEPEADAKDEAPADDRDKKALYAEMKRNRERAQAAEAEAKRLAQVVELGNKRLEQIFAQQQPKPAPEPEIPDFNADPAHHLKAEVEALKRELQAVREPFQQQTAEQQFYRHVDAAERQYATTVPDYFEAAKFLSASLAAEEQLMGLPPGTLAKNIAATAIQNGRDPAEVAYRMAGHRGYSRQSAEPAVPDTKAAESHVETVRRGTQAGRSLSAAPGQAPQALTLEAIANMSQDQFDALMAKNPAAVERAFRSAH